MNVSFEIGKTYFTGSICNADRDVTMARVIRISDGIALTEWLHPTVAATIAARYNRNLYNCGPYCRIETN